MQLKVATFWVFSLLTILPVLAVDNSLQLPPAKVMASKTNKNAIAQAAQSKQLKTNPPVVVVVTNPPPQVVTNTAPQMPGDLFTNSVKMEFVKVGGGRWAGQFEVTQEAFQKVMGANPSQFQGPTHPVDNITYGDALEFCKKLTEQELKDEQLPKGFRYTLPTEAEWEGLVDNAQLSDAVTSLKGDRSGTSPVGSLGPNGLKLYDTRGNVMEFCKDESKPYRVLRGGSWKDFIEVNLRLEFRHYARPDEHQNTFGFRCLLVQDGDQK